MWKKHFRIVTVALTASSAMTHAAEIAVTLHAVTMEGISSEIGRIRFEDSEYGLLIRPDLHGLPPGPHDTHVHENLDCGPAERDGELIPAGAAGGHYDPHNTGRSDGPYGNGALGDLPNLIVEHDGAATIPILAPRLKVDDLHGRALVIHAGPGRYGKGHASHHHDEAAARRIACGVIE